MSNSTSILLVIDPIGHRVLVGGVGPFVSQRRQFSVRGNAPLLRAVDRALKGVDLRKTTLGIGVYPGPGPFTAIRKGVLLAHWLCRTVGGDEGVREVPLEALESPASFSSQWEKFPIQRRVRVRYGRPASITVTGRVKTCLPVGRDKEIRR